MAEIREALGLVETKGFVGMIEASDAMGKAAKVCAPPWKRRPRPPSGWASWSAST
jgi:ethanolamine utilization protein EutM